MTIALVLKVNDGLVLAADSATSMMVTTAQGASGIENVYNNANKIFNLHKSLPIGAMTWGLGNVGTASISTVAKDIRRAFHEGVDKESYKIEDIATDVHQHLIKDRYDVQFPTGGVRPALGFLVAGYSDDDDSPRLFVIHADGSSDGTPVEVLGGDEGGATWWGQPEAISRILNGFSLDTANAVVNMGIADQANANRFVQELASQVAAQLVHPAMPIQDAIDLAEFLVHSTIQYVRFQPGAPTVGGPIEIATITKHEGFKWVARKHYFKNELNPGRD